MKADMLAAAAVLGLALAATAQPQTQGAGGTPPPAAATQTFPQQELDRLLAPIALYPDALLAQVLMASTYPLDIVNADRWIKANPGLKDKALEDALQQQPWDASVKSLAVVPQVLAMMSEKLDWTQQLGDAFLAQQKDVMATVQALRGKAAAQGSLKDSKEQKVITETAGTTTVIKVEPANPEVVYVPTYNPTVVYGTWPYPAYPPYSYYPPGYAAGSMLFSFTAGAIVGGALWGDCDWGRGDVDVNVNKYNNFNRTNISNRNWSHNTARRGAVPYRDRAVAQQYGRARNPGAAASREQFRGRTYTAPASAGRADAARGSVQRNEAARDLNNRDSTPRATVQRGEVARNSAPRSAGNADSQGLRRVSAFDTGSAARTHDFSNRGAASLNSARGSGNFGGARGGRR